MVKKEYVVGVFRTPKYGIAIGRAVEMTSGEFGVEFKRKDHRETISLSELVLLIKKNSTTYGMVYSPKLRIPIGCAVRTASGEIGLEIKRNSDFEVITIKALVSQLVHTVDAAEERRVPA